MLRTITLNLTGVLLISLPSGGSAVGAPAPGADGFGRFRNLPRGWTVSQSAPLFEREMAGRKVRIANLILTVGEQPFQVNTVECKSDEHAARVQDELLRAQGEMRERCPREGSLAFEFVAKDMRLVERAYLELGFKPPKVTYDVSFHATPIAGCNSMSWNKLFNAFLAPAPSEVLIREISKDFTFGDRIRLRAHGLGSAVSSYSFSPAARDSVPKAGGELTAYSFAELPRRYGVPQVALTGVITSEAFAITPSTRKLGKELLGATEFWPATDPEIVALAKQIVARRTEPGEKLAALLEWFVPAQRIKYSGEVMGSRYGVKAVLKQGFGRCWDFSDCFVTLCRAAGVPSRQVFGWLYGQSGHVWAEVFIEGKGWRQVDPTAGMGCDRRYVPFIASEDGAMPIVYTSAVHIAPRAAKDKQH